MNVTQTSTAAAAAAAATQKQTQGESAVLSSDFETFLKMLTAQAKYQNPLEPIDSSEYAAQLAQFSMVEQQVLSNDLLTDLKGALGASNMATLAGWVGMEARAATPMFFNGAPITVSSNPSSLSDQAFLLAYDATGAVASRTQIPVSAEPVQWLGVDANGDVLPEGIYSFAVESLSDGQIVGTEPSEVYGRITEAQNVNGTTMLIMEGGTAVLSSHVTALRAPNS
jgi:flagellar basal-body rod modification protein FlgD